METSYRTIFGFTTENAWVGRFVQVVYVFIGLAAWFFAFDGLQVILYDWSPVMRGIVATAIVGLAISVKLILFGRKKGFGAIPASVAMVAALAALTFDFFGLYEHTGVATMLAHEKAEAEAVCRDYNVVMRRDSSTALAAVESKRSEDLAAVDAYNTQQIALLEQRVSNAQLTEQDEKAGVHGNGLSGVPGTASHALERESDTRRARANYDIDKKALDADVASRKQKVNGDADAKVAALTEGVSLLDNLVGRQEAAAQVRDIDRTESRPEPSVVEAILAADNFGELADAARRGNALMGQISGDYAAGSGQTKDPKDIVVHGGNLFDLSVRGLLSWDIAAIVSLFLAFLFEWMDILVVFAIRTLNDENDDRSDDNEADGPQGRVLPGPHP